MPLCSTFKTLETGDWRASEEYLYKYFGCQQSKLVLGRGNTFVISGLQSQLLHPLALLPRQEMRDTNTDFDTRSWSSHSYHIKTFPVSI